MSRRVAFVSGASRGIGAATACALARRGYDVAIGARTLAAGERHAHANRAGEAETPLPGSLEETAERVRALGADALALRMDLLDAASLAAALDAARERWGRIDVLVNNAIVQIPGSQDRVADLVPEDARRVFQGNVHAPVELVRRVLPGMLERGEGAIVNLVSAAGFSDPPAPTGEGGWGFAYAASKAALARLAGVLAVEHRDAGVRFFNVEPGFVVTEMVRASGLLEEFGAQWEGAPPEVPGEAIAWLVADDAGLEWHGRTVDAQRLCRERGLVPGWPTPKPPRSGAP